jgi:membrane-bound lytic murein transglycosylase D
VEKPGNMDVALAARLAETPLDEFRALNPAYNRPVAAGQAHLVVPADKVETFLSNLESHDKPLVTWSSYTLKRGDRLDKIAAGFGISGQHLRQINGIKPRVRVAAGRTLLVPASRDAPPIGKPILANLPSADAGFDIAMEREDKPTAKSKSKIHARKQGSKGKATVAKTGKRPTATASRGRNGKARKTSS